MSDFIHAPAAPTNAGTPWNLALVYEDSHGQLHLARSEAELVALCIELHPTWRDTGPTAEQMRAVGRICAMHVDNAKRSAVAHGWAPEPTLEPVGHRASIKVTALEIHQHLGA